MATDTDKKNTSGRKPSLLNFWMPWGVLGCLWRTLLFLLGIFLLCLLFSLLLRGCDKTPGDPDSRDPREEWPDTLTENPYIDPGTTEDPYAERRDETPVPIWNDSIPGVPELPPPAENRIPPVDTSRVIINPVDSTAKIVGDELIVFFSSTDLKKDMADFARRFKELYPGDEYSIKYYNPVTGSMLLSVPQEQLMKVRDELPGQIPEINFIVTTNEVLRHTYKPSDPEFTNPRYDDYFELIQAYDAWDITKGSPEIKVAIIDSYFDLSNPEIGNRYINPIHIPSKTANVYPPAEPPTKENVDVYAHGSHVAGIAVGGMDNGLGVSGIAPNCTWIPISLGFEMTHFNIMEAILYAIYQGADVINMSIGRTFPDDISEMPLEMQVEISQNNHLDGQSLWERVMQIADEHNCVMVTSAGNETILMGMDPKNRNEGLIPVEAVDRTGIAADFSNFGEVPEHDIHYSTIAAPGVAIWSTSEKRTLPLWEKYYGVRTSPDGFQEMQGTSMAAPMVAGAVALLKSKNKNLTNAQVKKILNMTAKQTDTEHRIGPTIQLRDALDATPTGDVAKFDDIMKDHSLLLGKWRSTHEINLVESDTEKKLDEMWLYFTFTSETSGYLEYQTIETRATYRADVKVNWSSSSFTIVQLGNALSPGRVPIEKDDFVCRPDESGLLQATTVRDGKERYKFKLEKVK